MTKLLVWAHFKIELDAVIDKEGFAYCWLVLAELLVDSSTTKIIWG